MYQPLVHKRLFTKREAKDLVHILLNKENKDQKIFLDLDGTLHKGLCEKVLRGMSNADLALLLLPKVLQKPRLFPKYCKRNLEIFLKDRQTLRKETDPKKRQDYIKELTTLFCEVLSMLPKEWVQETANRLPQLQYPQVKKALEEIIGEKTIVSCGLKPIIQAYARDFGLKDCYGNRIEGNTKGIYGAEDKEKVILQNSQQGSRIIVIGDTEDDIGMAKAARKRNEESIVIAIHNRSDALAQAADIVTPSWKDLTTFIAQYQTQQLWQVSKGYATAE